MTIFTSGSGPDNDKLAGPASKHHRHDRHKHHVNAEGTPIRSGSSGLYRALERPNEVQFGADQLPSNAFAATGSFFDIQITGAGVDYLDQTILQYGIFNPAPGSMRLVPSPWHFDRIELMYNGSQVDDTIYPEQAYLDQIVHFGIAEKYGYLKDMNFRVNFNTTALANRFQKDDYDHPSLGDFNEVWGPSETKTLFYPIFWSATQTNIFLPAKKVNPRFRFYTAVNPQTNTSGALATNPVLSQVQMIIHGPVFSPSVRQNLHKQYSTSGKDSISRTFSHERQIIDVVLNSGIESADQSLTALNGQFINMFYFTRLTTALREELYSAGGAPTPTWFGMSDVTLLDSSGNPVGYNREPWQWHNGKRWYDQFPECFVNLEKCIASWNFAKDPLLSVMTGANTGGLYLDGNFVFRFTPLSLPNNTIPAGTNAQLIMVCWRYAQLTQTKMGGLVFKKL